VSCAAGRPIIYVWGQVSDYGLPATNGMRPNYGIAAHAAVDAVRRYVVIKMQAGDSQGIEDGGLLCRLLFVGRLFRIGLGIGILIPSN